VVLAGRAPQDFQHLSGAYRAGGHERDVRRVQPVPADHLGLCGSLRGQAITLIVGVPAQLHVPHERVLSCWEIVMLILARIIRVR